MVAALAAALVGAPALAAGPAGNVKAGVDAWTRGDYPAAIEQWRGPAENGDADAQFNLAQAYKLGKGVPADLKLAEDLYAKAARAGHLQAADNYGLLLFQTRRRTDALEWIVRSAERGEPRAQYVLGTAHFNGDLVLKDRIRAYALMSRAAAAGLEQAKESLAAMDEAIPLAERQQAVVLAAQLEEQSQALRGTQFAAADLGDRSPPQRRVVGQQRVSGSSPAVAPSKTAPPPPKAVLRPNAVLRPEPVTAGADFADPVMLGKPASQPTKVAPPQPQVAARPARVVVAPAPAAAAAAAGQWRVQLGAFSVAGNAEAQWSRLKTRPALAGADRFLVPAGGMTRLQAGPFASKTAADAACAALAGQACIPVKP